MARSETAVVAVTVALLALGAWLLSCGGHARVSAQLRLAGRGPAESPLTAPPVTTGIVPEKWVPHVPRGAHFGPHRIYNHPKCASPNLTAPQHIDHDWLWCPPSEGDL